MLAYFGPGGRRSELGHEQRQQVLRKLHAELIQGALELKIVDGARAVPVKMPEYILPVLDVSPKAGELVEIDVPGSIYVLANTST
jgi:hypothetical protein